MCSIASARLVERRSGCARSKRALAFCVSPLNPQTQTTTLSFGNRSRICLHMARAGANA